MRDHGDKIVLLAREILAYERATSEPNLLKTTSAPKTIPIKTACLAVLAATLGGALTTQVLCEMTRPATRFEQFEIDALVFYIAREASIPQEKLREELLKSLRLDSLQDVTATDYNRIRQYLWHRLEE